MKILPCQILAVSLLLSVHHIFCGPTGARQLQIRHAGEVLTFQEAMTNIGRVMKPDGF